MSDNEKLLVYANLQQAVLDCADSELLLPTFLQKAIEQFPSLGFTYNFIDLIFFDEQQQVLSKYHVDNRSAQSTSLAIDLGRILADTSIKAEIMRNQLTITQDKSILAESYRTGEVKTVIISPIRILRKIVGVICFGSAEAINEVLSEEKQIIEIYTNSVAAVYRLQDTEKSLTTITQQVYEMNAKLHQLDKLKDDFVSVASHELRTPMTAIKSYLWMALNKRKEELSPNLQKYLDRAYISVDRLISLVNDMLNVSRIEGGRIELNLSTVDLVVLAKDVVEEVLPKAVEKGVGLEVIPSTIPNVLCDKNKIHEVYLNYIGNSLKFTPSGGKITIQFEQDGDYIKASVTDTGRGIAPEDIQRLFQKFGRLANSYVAMAESSGTGLGLYITKSLIELHKGVVSGTSLGLDKGATFTFTLPIVGTSTARNLTETAPKPVGEVKQLEHTTITI